MLETSAEQPRRPVAVRRSATIDALTGLPDRAQFKDCLSRALPRQRAGAVLCIDLDHFKEINDALGHAVGDDLLRMVAGRLRNMVRDTDLIARLGDDEFALLLSGVSRTDALALAGRCIAGLQEPLQLAGLDGYRPQVSVGLAMHPEDGGSAEALLCHADQAMTEAKQGGGNRLQSYDAGLFHAKRQHFDLKQQLRDALVHDQLRVFLQPKFRLVDMAVVGAEALVRWQHPERGLLAPVEFLPLAIEHQILGDIDAWMLRNALAQLADWRRRQCWPGHWRLALNADASGLSRSSWFEALQWQLRRLGLSPQWLEFELTEEVCARPTAELLHSLQRLRALGVSLSIDDFGTGYSSLAYLKQLPINGIKIDRLFVRDICSQQPDRVLVDAMVGLTRCFGLNSLAEGVETDEQRLALLQAGCEFGQGHLLGQALPSDEFEARFLQGRHNISCRFKTETGNPAPSAAWPAGSAGAAGSARA